MSLKESLGDAAFTAKYYLGKAKRLNRYFWSEVTKHEGERSVRYFSYFGKADMATIHIKNALHTSRRATALATGFAVGCALKIDVNLLTTPLVIIPAMVSCAILGLNMTMDGLMEIRMLLRRNGVL